MDKDEGKLHELIVLFLQVNPEPSDDQFHALAHALGVDKESLEACAYEMLGDEIHHEEGEGDESQLEELVRGSSTHFEEGEGGEYGEGYPVQEESERTEAFVINAAYRLAVMAEVDVEESDGEQGETGISEQQEVLQGDQDPATTNTDDMVLNDGAPVGQSTDDEMQDSQLVDGVGPDDTGVGFDADKSMLLNDGAPALQLQNASARRLTAAPESKVKKIERLKGELKEVVQRNLNRHTSGRAGTFDTNRERQLRDEIKKLGG
jgi:hypothetical protein